MKKRHYSLYRKSHAPRLKSEDAQERRLKCARCKAVFPDYLGRCPECGGREWEGFVEVNPYTRLPLEHFLLNCGHLFWISGTLGFLALLWQTASPDAETNVLNIYAACTLLLCGVLLSTAYFALSEILRRLIRLQGRLRVFHENYRDQSSTVIARQTRRQTTSRRPRNVRARAR